MNSLRGAGQIRSSQIRSPLREAMRLQPGRGATRKRRAAVLVLTSLDDAFSIMLLYLLVQNSGNGSTLELRKSQDLPMAVKAEALHEGTLVRFENGRYSIGDETIEPARLPSRLQELKTGSSENSTLIIQADRLSDFSGLAHVIRSGSISGFNKFKFAVLQEEGGRL